ncbi:MAG: alpha/beta hydrolase [Rikenellaceae bacterium]|nr:alpha/beta hydrolase [Rikenellaceae bacterium]
MKKIILMMFLCFLMSFGTLLAAGNIKFDAKKFVDKTLELHDGASVKYRAYENIYYVGNVVDSVCQTLNIFVPESAFKNNKNTPIFLKTNVGGYRASKASGPSAKDATGRALQEGYIVVIPGSRGSDSKIKDSEGNNLYTGRAPAAIVDLKAAIRYLRYNKKTIPGNTDLIITDGTSAGGALSALLGASGNSSDYEPYLSELGAAKERDDVFAVISFCPITDLEHADMAYEWIYSWANIQPRGLSPYHFDVAEELDQRYPEYQNNLGIKLPDGTALTTNNYLEYLKTLIADSAKKALDKGEQIDTQTGVTIKDNEIVVDLDAYLAYIPTIRSLKIPPAFDKLGVLEQDATPENQLFGNSKGEPANFTDMGLKLAKDDFSLTVSPEMKKRVYLMNPMNYIGEAGAKTAENWYIRHGAVDRDTAFQVPVNLALKLQNIGYNVDFDLSWGRGHMGDYDLDEVFEWIRKIVAVN